VLNALILTMGLRGRIDDLTLANYRETLDPDSLLQSLNGIAHRRCIRS